MDDKAKNRAAYLRQWNKEHREEVREYQRRYRADHKEDLASKKRAYNQAHRKEIREYQRGVKLAALNAYGGLRCACPACPLPEPGIAFLSIDHINNDGAHHRRQIGTGRIYWWLKKNDYPTGFQVLCLNCNFAKGHNGGVCPHLDSL